MPKVSIVIPAYNTADVISRTLKSIENQTYKNYEIVVINDGSTDGTREFLEHYKKDKEYVIVHHQENQGVSVARNKGIELASGEFICFLDSDDTYKPDFLEKMTIRQNETGGKVIYTGYNYVNEKLEVIHFEPKYFKNGDILPLYYTKGCFIHFSGILINRQFLLDNSINFEVGRKMSEDILFTVKCFNLTESYVVEDYLFNYFYRQNSVVNSKWSVENWMSDLDGNKKVLSYIKENYNAETKSELIKKVEFRLFERELGYLHSQLIELNIENINNYLKDSDFSVSGKKYSRFLTKSNYKKYKFIRNESKTCRIIGYIYYNFLRKNLKNYFNKKL